MLASPVGVNEGTVQVVAKGKDRDWYMLQRIITRRSLRSAGRDFFFRWSKRITMDRGTLAVTASIVCVAKYKGIVFLFNPG